MYLTINIMQVIQLQNGPTNLRSPCIFIIVIRKQLIIIFSVKNSLFRNRIGKIQKFGALPTLQTVTHKVRVIYPIIYRNIKEAEFGTCFLKAHWHFMIFICLSTHCTLSIHTGSPHSLFLTLEPPPCW